MTLCSTPACGAACRPLRPQADSLPLAALYAAFAAVRVADILLCDRRARAPGASAAVTAFWWWRWYRDLLSRGYGPGLSLVFWCHAVPVLASSAAVDLAVRAVLAIFL